MKQKQLLKTFLVAVCLLMGTNAWADTTVVGATDNSDAAYYTGSHYARYSVENNKRISIEFTVSTATDEQLGETTWGPWFAWAVNFWDGTLNAITVEARDYGWEDKTENTRWTTDWAKYWAQNYPTGWGDGTAFRDIIQGATVVATVERRGTYVSVTYDITTTGGVKYRQYAVKEYGDGTTIWFDLIVNHTHITIDNAKTATTNVHQITGTLIGNYNKCTGFTDAVNAVRQNFTIAPNGSLNLKFKNYSAGVFTWQSWMFEMLYNEKYCNMVAGNLNAWGELREKTGEDSYNQSFSNTNWPTDILTQMQGATVELTITRSGANVSVVAVHTPVSGDAFTLNYSFSSTEENFATSNAEFHLISDYGYLDLLPVTGNISDAGWATYCSPYALDLANATGLTDAYIVTGGSTGILAKTSVKDGTVPANTGLLLKGDEGTVTIPIVGSSSINVSANKLRGVTTETEIDANAGYVLLKENDVLGFYKNSNRFTLGANTAYLPANFDQNGGARTSYLLFDDMTGISQVAGGKVQTYGAIYNLNGQRVSKPTKGIYIIDGVKVAIE